MDALRAEGIGRLVLVFSDRCPFKRFFGAVCKEFYKRRVEVVLLDFKGEGEIGVVILVALINVVRRGS